MKSVLTILLFLAYLQTSAAQGVDLDAEPLLIDFKQTTPDKSITQLPPSKSLKSYCPTVGKQQYHDCVGWAVGYAAMAIVKAKQKGVTGRPELIRNKFSLDPMTVYKNGLPSQKQSDCQTTVHISDALNALKSKGAPVFKPNTYTCKPTAVTSDVTKLENWQVGIIELLKNDKATNVKRAIANDNPVVIKLNSAVLDKNRKNGEGHAVCIVGYDQAKGFEIMNSWGTDWGEKKDGFGWLSYADFEASVNCAYEIKSKPNGKGIGGGTKKEEKTINIKIQLPDTILTAKEGELNDYLLKKDCPSGTRFNIKVDVPYNTFATLVWGAGQTADVQQDTLLEPLVFPPVKDLLFKLDNTLGIEHFAILFSESPLSPEEKAALDKRQGSELNAYLTKKYGTVSYIRMDTPTVTLTLKYTEYLKKPLWVTFQMKHTR